MTYFTFKFQMTNDTFYDLCLPESSSISELMKNVTYAMFARAQFKVPFKLRNLTYLMSAKVRIRLKEWMHSHQV